METKTNIIEQDILLSNDPIVGHCCNTQNRMGSGVAGALRRRFPEVYEADTMAYITHGKNLLGKCIMVPVETEAKDTGIKVIANLYGQPNYGYDGKRYVDYEALYTSLCELRQHTSGTFMNCISLPYKLGSDRAGGHWPIVLEMIKHVFDNTGITINLHKL